MKILNPNNLLQISLYSIFIAVLFKPGSAGVGMYEWMVRPSYIVNMLKIIHYASIGIFLLSSILFFIYLFKYNMRISKSFIVLSVYFAFYFIMQFINYMTNGIDFSNFIFRLVLMLSILLIILNYYKLNKSNLQYLFPIVITGGVFVVVNMLILIVDPTAVWPNSMYARMFGITEHPNFFAMICAVTTISAFELMREIKSSKDKYPKKINVFLLIIFSLSLLGVFFSGSRTGLLFVITGVFLSILRSVRTLRDMALFSIFVILLLGTLYLAIDSLLNVEGLRVTSTANNRSGAWDAMISIFMNHIDYGIGLSNVNYSENSYLRALASSGLSGGILFFIFIFTVLMKSINRFKDSSFSILLLLLLFTALSEGFLLDTFSFILLVFLYSVSTLFSVQNKGVKV